MFKFIQGFAPCVRGKSFIACDSGKFLQPTLVFFFGLYDFLLLLLIGFIGFFHSLCLGFHAYHCNYYAGYQCCNQDIGIGKHGGIKHLLGFFHQQQPIIVQGFRCCCPPFCCCYKHNGGTVGAVGGHQSQKYAPKMLIVLYHIRYTRQSGVDDTFTLLPKFIEHHRNWVLDVGDLSCNSLWLLLHKSTEFATFIGQTLYDFLNFRKTDLASFHQFTHLAFCHSELLGKFCNHWNTTIGKLIEVLGVHTTLRHSGAIQINKVIQWYT